MRFIHTADWHLGNSIHKSDRTTEVKLFFEWLKNTIVESKSESLIIAGDIFDEKNPPTWARTDYYDFLVSLRDTDCRNIIIVGGNHDSGNLLDSPKEVLKNLEFLNVRVVGSLSNTKLSDVAFELYDKEDNVIGICAAVPFVHGNEFDLIDPVDINAEKSEENPEDSNPDNSKAKQEERTENVYAKVYAEALKSAKLLRGDRDVPIITTGHLFASGLETRSDNIDIDDENHQDNGIRSLEVVGNLGRIHDKVFTDEFQYVALGHIHYATRVSENNHIRYSGSPFVMGFYESDIKHYVLQVDVNGNEKVKFNDVKRIEVPCFNHYIRAQGTYDDIIAKINECMESHDNPNSELFCQPGTKIYVELYYKPEDRVKLEEYVYENQVMDKLAIVSWHPVVDDKSDDFRLGDYTLKEMKNKIQFHDVIRSLVLTHKANSIPDEVTDEERKKIEDELVEKYYPYFKEAWDAVEAAEEAGDSDEDN